jgi:hypothetical protein
VQGWDEVRLASYSICLHCFTLSPTTMLLLKDTVHFKTSTTHRFFLMTLAGRRPCGLFAPTPGGIMRGLRGL